MVGDKNRQARFGKVLRNVRLEEEVSSFMNRFAEDNNLYVFEVYDRAVSTFLSSQKGHHPTLRVSPRSAPHCGFWIKESTLKKAESFAQSLDCPTNRLLYTAIWTWYENKDFQKKQPSS